MDESSSCHSQPSWSDIKVADVKNIMNTLMVVDMLSVEGESFRSCCVGASIAPMVDLFLFDPISERRSE